MHVVLLEVKVNSSLGVIKHHAMKTYGGVEVQLQILNFGIMWR
jgi:hypothetical protein